MKTASTIDLSTLAHEQYRRIERHRTPSGCSDACPCRATGLVSGRAIVICTDPRRYRRLKATDTRLANDERRRQAEQAYTPLTAHVDGLQEITPRAMALVASYALHNLAVPIIKATSKRAGLEIPTDNYQVPLEAATFDALAALAPLQQLQLVVEAILRSQLAASSNAFEPHDALAWYTERDAPIRD